MSRASSQHPGSRYRNLAQEMRRSPFALPAGFGDTNTPHLVDHDDYTTRALGSLFQSLTPTLSKRREIQLPYQDVWAIYACIRARARAARKVQIRVYESDAPDAKPLPASDPLVQLLAKPNLDMSWAKLIDASVVHLDLSGENFWFKTDDKGAPFEKDDVPSQLIPVNGDIVTGNADSKTNRILAWKYTSGLSSLPEFKNRSVVHFSDYDPQDPQRGMGKAEVALRTASIIFQTERYLEGSSRAGGVGAFLNWKKSMSPTEEARLQTDLEQKLNRNEEAGRLRLLTGEWQVIPNPADPKKMQSVEVLASAVKFICSIFGVPPPVIGFYEEATYNNVEAAFRQFWLGVWDDLSAFADAMNAFFIPTLGPRYARCVFKFDPTGIDQLRRDDSKAYDTASQIAARGVGVSYFDICTQMGLDTSKLPKTSKVVLVPSMMATLEQVLSGVTWPTPDAGKASGEDAAKNDAKDGKALPAVATKIKGRHPPLNAEERAAYLEQLTIRILTPGEKRFAARTAGWFRSYERALIARLRAFAEQGTSIGADKALDVNDPAEVENFLLLNEERWARLLLEATTGTRESVFASALGDQASELGVPMIPMTDPRVLTELATQDLKLAEGVTSRLADAVRETLLEALTQVETVGSLQLKVKENLPALEGGVRQAFSTKDQRAQTIARTEVGKAVSTARFMQMDAAGITKHQWLTSHGPTVREAHEKRDGTIVTIGAEFAPNLRYPKDPNGPAEEVINCQCEALAVVEEDQ